MTKNLQNVLKLKIKRLIRVIGGIGVIGVIFLQMASPVLAATFTPGMPARRLAGLRGTLAPYRPVLCRTAKIC